METYRIIIIICGCVMTVVGVFNIAFQILTKDIAHQNRMIKGVIGIIFGGIMVAIGLIALPAINKDIEKRQEIQEAQKNKAVSEYKFYLDGNEVDPKTIDLDKYEWSYNDSDKIVTLTKPDDNNASLILMIVCLMCMFAGSMAMSNRHY